MLLALLFLSVFYKSSLFDWHHLDGFLLLRRRELVGGGHSQHALLLLLLLLSDVRDDEFGDPLHDDVYGGSGGFGTEKTNKTWLHGMIAVPFLASS